MDDLARITLPDLTGWFTISRSRQAPTAVLETGWRSRSSNRSPSRTSRTGRGTAGKKKLATYDTDPDYFYSVFRDPQFWPRLLREDQVVALLEIIQGEDALPVHESWLNRAMWIERMDSHAGELNRWVRMVGAL